MGRRRRASRAAADVRTRPVHARGLAAEGLNLLIVRWSRRPNAPASAPRNETLWRVPITGGPPVSTGLMMDRLRDVSIHPDGRRVAFNAGMKRVEHWVMENVLPR